MAKKTRGKNKIQWSQKKLKHMLLITALLIIPPFILWGITTAIQSNRNYFVGKVGKWSITRPLWRRTLDHIRIDMLLKTGRSELNPQISHDLAWERLLLLYAAKQKKLHVTDKELANYIQSLPLFKDKTGRFSLERYRSLLFYYGLREKDFEETLREDLLIEKLQQAVTHNISVSKKEVQEAWQKEKEKLQLKYKIIPIRKFLTKINPTEQELLSYYKKHKQDLIIPEKMKISLLQIPKEDFSEKDKYLVEKKKITLAELAKKYKLQLTTTPFLSPDEIIPETHLPMNVYQHILSLKKGQLSKPISDNDKYIVLKIIAIQPKHIATFQEIKSRLIKLIKYKKAVALAKAEAKKLIEQEKTNPVFKNWQETKEFSYYSYIPKLGPAQLIFDNIKKNCSLKKATFCGPFRISSNFIISYIIKYIPAPNNIPKKEYNKIKQRLLEQKRAKKFQDYLYQLTLKTSIIDSSSASN